MQSDIKNSSDMLEGGFQITFAALDDIESLVTLHLRCFSGEDHIAVLFGKNFVRAAYRWFVTDAGAFVLIAKKGQQLIGFTSLANRPYNAPMLRAVKKEALLGLLRRPWLAFHPELLLRVFRMIFPNRKYLPAAHVAHIAFTAVDSQFRGLGVAKALKQESIRICRERGLAAIVTGIKRQNLKAKAMNESVGFVEVPELSTKRFIYLKLDLGAENPPGVHQPSRSRYDNTAE